MLRSAAPMLLLAVASLAPAAASPADAPPRLHVDLYGNAQSVKEYARLHGAVVRVHREGELPDPALRDLIFSRVPGLPARIATYDAVDRDRLFVHAAGASRERLRSIFPAIPAAMLERLRVEVREEGFPVEAPKGAKGEGP